MFKALLVMLSLSFFSFTAHANEATDRAEIKTTVFNYFHGQGEASKERLFKAFAAEHATMVGITPDANGKEEIKSWKDMTSVLNRWASNKTPAGGDIDGEIYSTNIVDGRLAVVLFRSTTRFYDALTLAKVNGEWVIVGKSYILQ